MTQNENEKRTRRSRPPRTRETMIREVERGMSQGWIPVVDAAELVDMIIAHHGIVQVESLPASVVTPLYGRATKSPLVSLASVLSGHGMRVQQDNKSLRVSTDGDDKFTVVAQDGWLVLTKIVGTTQECIYYTHDIEDAVEWLLFKTR